MNSLISLLWQFQIPDSPIVTTILKNEYQKPHHYFYSQKQNRVLRKKNPNVITLLQEQIVQKDVKKTQDFPKDMKKIRKSKLLRIKRKKQSKIEVQLCEHVMAMNQLAVQQYEGEFSIIEQESQLILCTYGNQKKGQINIQYLSCDSPSTTDFNWKQKQKAVYHFVKQLSHKILVGLKRKEELNKRVLKQSENKYVNNTISKMELILALNLRTHRNSIQIVDAIKQVFSQSDFVSIMYYPITNSKLINQMDGPSQSVKNTKKQERVQIPQIQQKKIVQQKEIIPSTIQKLLVRKCECCGNEGHSEFKEISNEQFKKGRKKRNLAIRGFHEEYYQVCRNCYEQL